MNCFLLYLFIATTTIQLLYYLLIFSRLAFYKAANNVNIPTNQLTEFPAVSVIICAKNEAQNLQKYLPSILEQNYPHFEVIVVNDASTDETQLVLANFKKKYTKLVIVNTADSKRNMLGKKFALTTGIANSQHDILLLTDADCVPSSANWIRIMVQHFTQTKNPTGVAIILGYGPYYATPTLLNQCIQFETVYTAIQYLSFALVKMPYMGVGRNLCYHKSVFYGINGFAKHKHIHSGDDDLLIGRMANNQNTVIEINKQTFCHSEPPKTWAAWYQQKQRHLSTGKHYHWIFQLLLGLLSLSHSLFYISAIITLLLHNHDTIVIILFILRAIIQLALFKKILKKLNSSLSLWMIPILDFLYLFYYIIFIPSLLLNKEIKWKQRVL